MRFMVMVVPGSKDYEKGAMPEEKLVDEMMKFNQELVDAGVMLGGEGLHPTSKGARVAFSGGETTVTDGPFAESKEVLGGYWLWQVDSKEQALDWARRAPMEDGDVLEIRQVFEPEDFGPEVAARERALIDQIAQQIDESRQSAAPGS